MATRNLIPTTEYGTGYQWTNTCVQGTSTNNDANRYYVGGTTAYRSRISFTIPSDLPSNPTKIVIAIKSDSNFTPGYIRALLTTSNVQSDADLWKNIVVANSYCYSDYAGSSRRASDTVVSSSTTSYFVLNYNFIKGTTYYVGLFPMNGWNPSNWGDTWYKPTWLRAQNTSNTLTVEATYTATYTITYNGNGATSGSMSDSIATYGEDFITKQNTFIKTGYTFNGWNEKPDGTGIVWGLTSSGVYESGKSLKWTYTKSITLYAQWTADMVRIKIGSQWKAGQVNASVNNVWKSGTVYCYTNGEWKKST